jgi:hypothetical protein
MFLFESCGTSAAHLYLLPAVANLYSEYFRTTEKNGEGEVPCI